MSLYYEAAAIAERREAGSTLKSRVYGTKGLKSKPAQVYALLSEAMVWSNVLSQVIEQAEVLRHERKVCLRCTANHFDDSLKTVAAGALAYTHSCFTAHARPLNLQTWHSRAEITCSAPSSRKAQGEIGCRADKSKA